MATAQQKKEDMTAILLARWEQVSRKIEQLAEEFPVNKLEWHPRPGVRSCGDVLRHVAFWNQYVAATLRGTQADETANELPAAEYATKARLIETLRHSAAEVAAAMREPRAAVGLETAETVLPFLEHTSEHYGQLAVYARLLDMVPPASRA